MGTEHKIVIGDSRNMRELKDGSIQLIVTSPPYFNVKRYGDGKDNIGSIDAFSDYLNEMRSVFSECYRVLEDGRYLCVNISDVISNKKKYSIPAHFCIMLQKLGFEYREDIIWKKPDGLGSGGATSAGKRFGVFLQHPFPMYYYPNNIYEHILVFRKGKFNFKNTTDEQKMDSRPDLDKMKNKFNSDIWEFTPSIKNQYTRDSHPAMFPETLPEALISLYSYKGEIVLDPFLGSGTTMKVARYPERSSVGYEINPDYLRIIAGKIGSSHPDSQIRFIRHGGVAS